jgi:SAM-dependent MidA family methyltransferase
MPWRIAMAEALYGPGGFFTRTDGPGGAGRHFRTSATASQLFASALARLLDEVDEKLGRPDELDLIDVGAGGGLLLHRTVALAPPRLARRIRPAAVELAPRPEQLPDHVAWLRALPPPGSVTGLVIATEWLDNIPVDIAQLDANMTPRYVHVDCETGVETLAGVLDGADERWSAQWWPADALQPGMRIELGAPRDDCWASAVATLRAGLAVAVDYGHFRLARPPDGTLAGYRAGRRTVPVPNATMDLTVHVAVDALAAAGSTVAGRPAIVMTQAKALRSLGLDSSRPPLEVAQRDPISYVRALSMATQAAELMDPEGLGGHFWIMQPVRIEVS